MYPRGQPSLPDDPVTAYVNNLRATGAAPQIYDDSEGTDHVEVRPYAGVQRLHGLGIKQLRTGASTTPSSC
jgi:hypothetical protein